MSMLDVYVVLGFGNVSLSHVQHLFLCAKYSQDRYLIHDPKTGQTAAVDTPSAAAYARELANRGWKLTHILNTHHHDDHVGGNMELKTEGVKVYGPAADGNIPGMDIPLQDGDTFSFGGADAIVIGECCIHLLQKPNVPHMSSPACSFRHPKICRT